MGQPGPPKYPKSKARILCMCCGTPKAAGLGPFEGPVSFFLATGRAQKSTTLRTVSMRRRGGHSASEPTEVLAEPPMTTGHDLNVALFRSGVG